MNQTYGTRRERVLTQIFCACLILLSAAFLIKGFHNFENDAHDLLSRWTESRFILHRQDPFQLFLNDMHGPEPSYSRRRCNELTALYGQPYQPVYPPWAYAPMLIFVWPPAAALRVYYACIDIVSILVVIVGGIIIGKPNDRSDLVTIVFGTTAIASICTNLGNGNFGIIVTAAIMLAIWFDSRNLGAISGILFWIALMKPTLSLPFIAVFLGRRRWKPIIVAFLLCGIGCIYPWLCDNTSPLLMLRESTLALKRFQFGGYGLVNWLHALPIAEGEIPPLAALIAAVPVLGLLFSTGPLQVWKELGVLSVVARFGGYHMAHDNIVLVLLAFATWRIYFTSRNRFSLIQALLVGVSLWIPSSLTELGGLSKTRVAIDQVVGIVQHLIWLEAAVYVWRWRPAST